MRITLPEKIPVQKAFLFSAVLALAELAEGTLPVYALLVFLFFMGSTFAFNVAGGLSRPSGAYIFFYATLTVVLGTIYKALLGQPADSHLEAPVLTMSIYVVSIVAMLVAAYLTRKIVVTRNGIAQLLKVPRIDLNVSALGCLAVAFLIQVAGYVFPNGSGSILHAIQMVNYFLPLGILLGTIGAIRSSGGQRSTSALTVAALVFSMYLGLISFSKQAMFTPFVCWILGVAWAGFRLKPKHILAVVVFCIFAQKFLVPLANIGHVDGVDASVENRVALVEKYIEHPIVLQETNETRVQAYAGVGDWYFGKPQGILDRLTMLAVDSQLISFSAQGHYFGYYPVLVYFENWVPHFIDPHKLEGVAVGGNRYAHEMGQLADDDLTTGISYSPSAEAFHLDGWKAVCLLQPCIYLLIFLTADAVCGDVRVQPWGLLPMLLFAHIAPEELLNGTINYVWLGNIATIFCIFISGYVTPVFGRLLQGRERAPVWQANVGLTRSEAVMVAETT